MLPSQISPEPMYGKHSSDIQPAAGAGANDDMSLFLRHLLSSSSSPSPSPSADRGKDPIRQSFPAAAGGGGDGDDYEWESEEGAEPSEDGAAAAAARSSRAGSKRSRAAEVHNLSEKRRRSRINEKMKALQNLIPNSNKTDKASMLDEAIEYLKQLQLQVQTLSMRNGMSLHPMYMPGAIQSLQIPNYANGFATSDCPIQLNNLSVGSLSVGEERQTAHGLPHQNSPSLLQPLALSNTLEIRKPTVAAVMDVFRAQQLPFHLHTSTMELHGSESLLGQKATDTSHSKQTDVRSSLANKEAICLEGGMLEQARLHLMGSNSNAHSEILIRQLDREEDARLLMGPK